MDGSDHGCVYMMWKKPKCFTDSPCGYADEFVLVYCLVSSVDNEVAIQTNNELCCFPMMLTVFSKSQLLTKPG